MVEINPYQAPSTLPVEHETGSGVVVTPELLRVAAGLRYINHGINSVILSFIGGPALILVFQFTQFPAFAIIGILMGIGILGGLACIWVGHLVCTAAPEQSRAKGLITAALILQSIGIFGILASFITPAFGINGGPIPIILVSTSWLMLIAWVASFFLTAGFLKRINQFIDNEDLTRAGRSTIQWMITIAVGYPCMIIFTRVARTTGNIAAQGSLLTITTIAAVALFVLTIVAFAKFTGLITRTSRTITRMAALEG